jgi:hypothetical protein
MALTADKFILPDGAVVEGVQPTQSSSIGPGDVALELMPYVAKTAIYTADSDDKVIDCTSGTFTLTLPTAIGITGKTFNIINSGTGVITIATTSSQTLGNTTSPPTTDTLTNSEVRNYISDGANWKIFA